MPTLAKLTAGDFARIAPVLGPCELIRGEIVPMSPRGFRHSRVTLNACVLLERYAAQHAAGRVVTGEAGVIVGRDPDTVRGADVAFISYERLPGGASVEGFLDRPPELIVEVLADDVSWQKLEERIAEYHACGVDVVWVLDPRTLALRRYPRGEAPSVLHDNDEVTGEPVLPGFRCRVAEFFRE
jgi:Uma2 family endonuclease